MNKKPKVYGLSGSALFAKGNQIMHTCADDEMTVDRTVFLRKENFGGIMQIGGSCYALNKPAYDTFREIAGDKRQLSPCEKSNLEKRLKQYM